MNANSNSNSNASALRHNPLSMPPQGITNDFPQRFAMSSTQDHRSVDASQRLDDSDSETHPHDDPENDSDHKSDIEKPRVLPPGQKRRRVTRACDECRRKKIKCDGRQPCTHCSVYSYECTYDQPSNRRRNPGPQYIEALESRVHKLEELMRVHAPGVDIDDPSVAPRLLPTGSKAKTSSGVGVKVKDESATPTRQGSLSVTSPEIKVENEEDMLESMIADTTAIDLDEMGHWDFHGSSSGRVFLRQVGHRLGDVEGAFSKIPPDPLGKTSTQRALSYDSPKSFSDSLAEEPVPLPDKETARRLCDAAINNGMVLMRFVHEPTFWSAFDHLLDTEQGKWDNKDHLHLPLIYACMAMGSLFTDFEPGETQGESYGRATQKGFRYFKAAKSLIDLTDIRELPSLQTLIFMMFFIQSSAKVALCYSYLGLAIHSALRMGMHRCIQQGMTKIEQESRSRMFWMVKKMDVYMGALLGLPIVLAEEDIDQALPSMVDDENITATEILPQNPNTLPLITGTVSHIKLLQIMKKVVKNVYPMRLRPQSTGTEILPTYPVSLSKIREIEVDLNTWMSELDPRLHPNTSTNDMDKIGRIQRLLRMAYGHVQMALYRPFLHTVAANASADKRAHACGIACVNVARNIVHITLDMAKNKMLIGAYWFTMYTTFFAIVSLMYYLAENPVSEDNMGIYGDAQAGRKILASLADRSMSASRCTAILNNVFEALGPRLDSKANDLKNKKPKSKKRPAPQTVQQTPAQNQTQTGSNSNSNSNSNENLPSGSGSAQTSDESVEMVSQPLPQFQLMKPNPFPKWLSQNPAIDMSTPEGMTSGSSHQGSLSPEYLQASSQLFPNTSTFTDKDLNLMPSMTAFSNMMFSPDDPLAYGNQPMLTLEKFGTDADLDINPFDMNDAAMMTGGMLDNYAYPKQGESSKSNANLGMGMFLSGVSTPDSSLSMSIANNSAPPPMLNVGLNEQTQRRLAEMSMRQARQSLSTPSGQTRSRPTSQVNFDNFAYTSAPQQQTSAPQQQFDMNSNMGANNVYNPHMDMLGLGFDASSFGMGLGLGQDWTDFSAVGGMQNRGAGGSNNARKNLSGGGGNYRDLDFSKLQ